MLFGPKLELRTEISTVPGSNSICVLDRITNRGGHEQEFQLIYHSNFGPPLLEKGARFVTAAEKIFPINENAASAINEYSSYLEPTAGFVEQVYCIVPFGDKNGSTTVMLRNAAGDKAMTMTYSLYQLPFLTLWKNTAAIEEGYVTGLEPGTGFPYNRRIERGFGRVPKLAPGETREFEIVYSVLDSSSQVTEEDAHIREIQGIRQTQIDGSPPKIG
jgi:hypothetical protein